jgi:endonuclease/exonuclease/phosphatase family metal-dependent hydrolase
MLNYGGDIMKRLLALAALLFSVQVSAKQVHVMAYNVENLFDTVHDQGTTDWTYLPLAEKRASSEIQAYCDSLSSAFYKKECQTLDWDESVLRKKIQNIARVISSVNEGRGPDVLVLEEVENLNVINMLADVGLRQHGFRYSALIEGDDTRGIDVGVLSKYPIVDQDHHSIYLNGKKLDTRGILEVTIDVEGKRLVVFANHWPSQGNSVEHRLASAELLARISTAQPAQAVVAMGDFNVVDKDNPHPFRLLDRFFDSETEARRMGVPLLPGTHFYRGEWSSLDRIFVHHYTAKLPDWQTFRIVSHPWMMQESKKDVFPKRFDPKTGEGYSDHLPIVVNLDL